MAVVYFHRRKDTNEVFYVGIGTKKKRSKETYDRSKFWWKVVKKYGYTIEIVHNDLTWEGACEYEKQYIKKFGRRDKCLGYLVNMTDGGDGTLGLIISEEGKRKIGAANKKRIRTEEDRKKISLRVRGEGNIKAKANRKIAEKIIKEYSKGNIAQSKLGEKYGLSESIVRNIVNGTTWKHLERPNIDIENISAKNNPTRKLFEPDVLEIRRLWNTRIGRGGGNISQKQLAEMFGVNISSIDRIVNKRTWKHI